MTGLEVPTETATVRRRLPRPRRATLTAFSLYERAPSITVEFQESGVFCLVGANGLGKSTFLTALNFAITGVVAEPGRTFRGVANYYKAVRRYSASYFEGRINDFDRASAQIELEMSVGDHDYRLVRSMFDPLGLRELEISKGGHSAIGDVSALSDEERHSLYAKTLTGDCGLHDFAQLVFLQHFVGEFDERRHLMFFDARVMDAALHIAFGADSESAKDADRLARVVEGLESRARNSQWHATDLGRQLKQLELTADDTVPTEAEAKEEHDGLLAAVDEMSEAVDAARERLVDAQLRIANHSSMLRAARNEYDQVWTHSLRGHGDPASHPVVSTSIDELRCSVCGTHGPEVVVHIQSALKHDRCPLCASPVESVDDGAADSLSQLTLLDAEIVAEQKAIVAAEGAVEAITAELTETQSELSRARQDLSLFENAYDDELNRGGAIGIDVLANRYRAEIERLTRQRDDERRRRDEARRQLAPLQSGLVRAYEEARERFLPNFELLAKQFLGLDLTVELQAKKGSVGLLLDVQGGHRRFSDSLSESQRFFIDIALRMALAEQLTQPDGGAVLYIDAPEGSLDIAYESRAGEMFGSFVSRGHQLVVTANLNTSKLLLRLAEVSDPSNMRLERMTDWTTLSEVQAEEEDLFDDAFRAIEEALER